MEEDSKPSREKIPENVVSERSPLIEVSSTVVRQDAEFDDEADELDGPWPATFQRSISLLAGPKMNASFVEKVTKSPKIYPPLNAKTNPYRRNLTPQLPPRTTNLLHPQYHFKQGITKIQSLDFPADSARISGNEARFLDLELRAGETIPARKSPTTSSVTDSPGYQREIETDFQRAKMKKDHDSSLSEKASFFQCMFNMMNCLMGIGMLALPYVFKVAGWVGGFLVTVIFSFIAWKTSIYIGRELNGDPRPRSQFEDDPLKSPTLSDSTASVRVRKPIKSFPDIATEAFGYKGRIILSLVLYFELFSCLCIFTVTMGDHLHSLFPTTSAKRHMLYASLMISIPTALLRTPRLISYLSAVGSCATILLVLGVLSAALHNGDISNKVNYEGTDDVSRTMWRTSGIPSAFGLIAFTFAGHAIVPSIYDSMRQPKDFEKMVTCSFLAVTFCCLVVAISGYYMFGSAVEDQITLSLEKADGSGQSTTMLTWLMILTAFCKYTLNSFPVALAIEELIAPFVSSETIMDFVSSFIKFLLISLSLIVSVFVPSFSYICTLVGLLCTMFVSVVFPAGAHFILFESHLTWSEKAIDCFLVLSGSIMAIVGTIVLVYY